MSSNDTTMSANPIRTIERIVEYLAMISGILTFFIGILTAVDIGTREIILKTIPGAYDLCQYLMVYIAFFAFAYCQKEGGNVRVDLILTRLPKKMQITSSLVSAIIALFIFAMIVYTNSRWTWQSFIEKELMYGIKNGPLWLIKVAIPFGCVFICLELIAETVRAAKQLIGREG